MKLAVDCIVEKNNKILLIKRKFEPFKGYYAFPGGFVKENETTEEAAIRELKEEANLDGKIVGLLGVYSDPKRDPRGRVVSIVYILKTKGKPKVREETEEVGWFDIEEIKKTKLAFDHNKMFLDYLKWRKRNKTLKVKNFIL